MSDVLNVSLRQSRGTKRARRQRKAGQIPAVLYGHGKDNLSLSIPAEQLESAIRHGSHVVDLSGDVLESALIKSVQWDTYGVDVLHVDLARVEKGESVTVTLAVELRGESPGTHEGGVVHQLVHEVEINCPVASIPDKLELKINALQLGGSIEASELELPAGAKLLDEPDMVIVQCVTVAVKEEEVEAAVPAAAEPEVIGRKAEEEQAEGTE